MMERLQGSDHKIPFQIFQIIVESWPGDPQSTGKTFSIPDSSLGIGKHDPKTLDKLWTNYKTVSLNYGGSLGVSYNFFKSFQLGGNFTYAKLSQQTRGDDLEDGFNTPEWNYNLSLGNPSVYKSLGFQVNFR